MRRTGGVPSECKTKKSGREKILKIEILDEDFDTLPMVTRNHR